MARDHAQPAIAAIRRRSWPGPAALLLGAALWLALLWNLPIELRHFRLPGLASVPLEIVTLLAALAAFAPLRGGAVADWLSARPPEAGSGDVYARRAP